MIPSLARAFLLLGAWAAQEVPATVAPRPATSGTPSVQERRIGSLFAGALVGVRDHEEFAETPGYREMLETLGRYPPEELEEKSEGHLVIADALGNPSKWRGRIVHVRSLVGKLETVRLERPLGERVDVYRAYIAEADGSEGLVVDFLQEPPELEMQKDVVDVDGVFMRIVSVENMKGDVVYMPQLIARNLRRFNPDEAPRKTLFSDPLAQITLGAGLVYLAVRVVTALRRKKVDAVTASRSSRAIRDRARIPPRPTPDP